MIMSSLTLTTLILTTLMLYAISSASPSAVSIDVDRELKYHNGTLLTGKAISINIIWYGSWRTHQKETITEFINSISGSKHQYSSSPSVSDWWQTVRLYTDYAGTNISDTVEVGTQITDSYSHGKNLTWTSVESVINSSSSSFKPLPNSSFYLLLTSEDVDVVGVFCQVSCGYNSFTNVLPYAWVGNSGKLCPGLCAFPFAVPDFLAGVIKPLVPPNGDVGLDGMIGEIAQEIVAAVTNPFNGGWYIGNYTNPITINHLCVGFFGNRADGSYPGQVLKDPRGASYNVGGIKRKFMVPWIWNYVEKTCTGRR